MPIIQTNKPLQPRAKFDHYKTPIEFARAGLCLLPDTFHPNDILDPGAGDGVWGDVARDLYPTSLVTGVDIRKLERPTEYDFWHDEQEFAGYNSNHIRNYDLVMGNPPYKFAEDFVYHSMLMLEEGGYLVFFLRLAFLESKRRLKLWEDYPLQKVAVCANRPSFTGDGKTNATAFAFFVWQKGYVGDTKLDWVLVK